jgi:hypothetical protein
MKGKLHKKINGDWVVLKVSQEPLPCDTIVEHGIEYLLHPDDVKQIHNDTQVFDNIEARIAAYPEVDFEIVLGFDNNGPDHFPQYAKLNKNITL